MDWVLSVGSPAKNIVSGLPSFTLALTEKAADLIVSPSSIQIDDAIPQDTKFSINITNSGLIPVHFLLSSNLTGLFSCNNIYECSLMLDR